MLRVLEQDLSWREVMALWVWTLADVLIPQRMQQQCLGRPVLPVRAQVLRHSKQPRLGIRNFKAIHASQRHLVLLWKIRPTMKPDTHAPKPLAKGRLFPSLF